MTLNPHSAAPQMKYKRKGSGDNFQRYWYYFTRISARPRIDNSGVIIQGPGDNSIVGIGSV